MRWLPIGFLDAHAALHLLGFLQAFGYADLTQPTQPISRAADAWWLVAAGLVATTAAMLGAGSRAYWLVGAVALVVSQAMILSAWRDAWVGTAANVVLLLVVAHGLLTEGPWSFHEQYVRDAHVGLPRTNAARVLTEADLAGLPDPVQRYLRVTRSVGQPRVQNYRLRFEGRIRSAPDSRWMPFKAEQQSFADQPAGLFLMRARMFGVPVEAFHRASCRCRVPSDGAGSTCLGPRRAPEGQEHVVDGLARELDLVASPGDDCPRRTDPRSEVVADSRPAQRCVLLIRLAWETGLPRPRGAAGRRTTWAARAGTPAPAALPRP